MTAPVRPPSVADLLAGGSGGAPGAFSQHSPIGTRVEGTIVSVDVVQMSDFMTKELAFWPDGNPKWQYRIIIQTDQRDPSIDGDEGKRAIYIKAFGAWQAELLDALRAAGVGDLKPGDVFAAKYDRDEPTKASPRKVYIYTYRVVGPIEQATGSPVETPAAAPVVEQAQPVQQTQPAAAPPAAPAPAAAGPNVPQIQALIAAGLDDAAIVANSPGATMQIIAALRAV